jgi:hypothetical protein
MRPDDDTNYEVFLPNPEAKRRGILGLIAAAFVLGALYVSIRPVMRLQAEMPSEFVDSRPDWNSQRLLAEERLARAYWECAVKAIQWKYAYGTNLPDRPPAEFQVAMQGTRGATMDARERYWRRLRKLWSSSVPWRGSYELHTDYIARAVKLLSGS